MGLETLNDHPLSKALIKYLENLNHVGLKNMNGNYIPGQGMVGDYKGKRYLVGNKKLLDQFSVKLTKNSKGRRDTYLC